MIVISKTFSLPQHYNVSRIAPLKDIVFLDLETTGLSPSSSGIYMIGVAFHEQMEWHLRQWFADSFSAEKEILEDFFSFIKRFRVIVTYNGDAFDLPFLIKCSEQYGLSIDVSDLESLDLYRKFKPLKPLLGLENLKLPSVEDFLGIVRHNELSGKDLIPIYKRYLETKDDTLYQSLFLHNEDDLKALPQLIPLLGYLDIFQGVWTLAGYSMNQELCVLTIVIDCDTSVPVALTYETDLYTISMRGNQLIVEMPVLFGELKYFYDNFSEYDYLPVEDRAIHRKVSQFVEKSYRVRATAATCYTRKTSYYLPLLEKDSMFPVFKKDYASKELYTEFVDDGDFLLSYMRLLLSGSEKTE